MTSRTQKYVPTAWPRWRDYSQLCLKLLICVLPLPLLKTSYEIYVRNARDWRSFSRSGGTWPTQPKNITWLTQYSMNILRVTTLCRNEVKIVSYYRERRLVVRPGGCSVILCGLFFRPFRCVFPPTSLETTMTAQSDLHSKFRKEDLRTRQKYQTSPFPYFHILLF